MTQGGAPAPVAKRPRWGLRTLGLLLLAGVAVSTALAMGGHTVGTLGCTVLGLGGAFYCSVQGIRDARRRGLAGILTDRRPPR
ncbi:hypothetical protein ACIB24_05620 [Spongisporangium articulatum]|uniref:Uncharacterized protein n=1 Tax=Spongisporangium articulatum TaxID=3362603 RepID=A0ABW8ALM2_9ACTN